MPLEQVIRVTGKSSKIGQRRSLGSEAIFHRLEKIDEKSRPSLWATELAVLRLTV